MDNLVAALHVLVHPTSNLYLKKEESTASCLLVFLFAAEHIPHAVLSAAHPEALSLQEHPGKGRTHCCGERFECEDSRITCSLSGFSEKVW